MNTTQSPFLWQGKPSIFTSGDRKNQFNGIDSCRSEKASSGEKTVIVIGKKKKK